MMILFVCNNPNCENHIKKYFKKPEDIPPFLDCGECGTGKMERSLGAPSTKTTQVIDNGIQARQVEIDNNVVEKERNRVLNNE